MYSESVPTIISRDILRHVLVNDAMQYHRIRALVKLAGSASIAKPEPCGGMLYRALSQPRAAVKSLPLTILSFNKYKVLSLR